MTTEAHRTAAPRLAFRLGVPALALAAVVGIAGGARAAECSIPQTKRGAILKAIEQASSCADAREIFQACASSTSGDVALSKAVVAKCEKLFKPQLSPVDRAEYDRKMKQCATSQVERGTESVSLAARCKAGVAADHAK